MAGAKLALQRKGAVQTLVATEGESQTDPKTVATWVGAFTLGVLASYHPYAEKFKFAPKVNVGVNLWGFLNLQEVSCQKSNFNE